MTRNASAVWNGGFKTGEGRLSTGNGLLNNAPYSFKSRFEDGEGTNPEEMIAAAHSGCYAMALTAFLEQAGFAPEMVSVTAEISMDTIDGAPTLTRSNLKTTARVPGIDDAKFQEVAADAKAKCPISRALNMEITLDATLV
jgi:osmotically inducible protein OsmC